MSTKDYDRFLENCRKEDFAAGLTDEEGRYTEETNTENQLRDIKENLIRLSVEILPDDFPNKKLLEDAIQYKVRNSYKTRETLFELVMKLRQPRNNGFKQTKRERIIMDNRIRFTQEELQLLYVACMSYGDKLAEIIKSIPNEETNKLSDRAKESWNLARKITEYMEDKS